ncbi:flagellar basal-body rod protein FlgF [Lacibacterium aquatile]|uniref:Flagellar basal-body rod protein FlgF n=1 Tax=Lacibacterium aquatile TaxID=1168082 RepID=A0ABW5DNM8_9PROT
MENTLPIAVSRMTSLRNSMNTTANNLANANTTGFRGEKTLFQEYLSQTGTPGNRESLSMVQDIATYRDFSEGSMTSTGNPMDLALRGDGFLVVGHPAQDLYTRAGALHLDNERRLVTSEGYPLLGQNNQAIQIPEDAGEVMIDAKGVVSVRENNQTNEIGRLQLVRFGDNQQLRPAGGSMFATDQTPLQTEEAQVVQGFIEGSNVKPVMEVTQMIEVMRDYASVAKIMEVEDQRMRDAANKLVRNV